MKSTNIPEIKLGIADIAYNQPKSLPLPHRKSVCIKPSQALTRQLSRRASFMSRYGKLISQMKKSLFRQ